MENDELEGVDDKRYFLVSFVGIDTDGDTTWGYIPMVTNMGTYVNLGVITTITTNSWKVDSPIITNILEFNEEDFEDFVATIPNKVENPEPPQTGGLEDLI